MLKLTHPAIMKNIRPLFAILFTLGAALSFAETKAPSPNAPLAPSATWLAQAQSQYPLKTCVVSAEEIGGAMGPGIDYVYQRAGQPDRLVRFCCKHCQQDFNQDPAKYLKLIDDAAKAK
jgi:hypothetical protein